MESLSSRQTLNRVFTDLCVLSYCIYSYACNYAVAKTFAIIFFLEIHWAERNQQMLDKVKFN